jgi:hypothetical protein
MDGKNAHARSSSVAGAVHPSLILNGLRQPPAGHGTPLRKEWRRGTTPGSSPACWAAGRMATLMKGA